VDEVNKVTTKYGCGCWYEDHVFHMSIGYKKGNRNDFIKLIEETLMLLKNGDDEKSDDGNEKDLFTLKKEKRKRGIDIDKEETKIEQEHINKKMININKTNIGHFAGKTNNVFSFDYPLDDSQRFPKEEIVNQMDEEKSVNKVLKESEQTKSSNFEIRSFFIRHGTKRKIVINLKNKEMLIKK
jgi:hypothetical protein